MATIVKFPELPANVRYTRTFVPEPEYDQVVFSQTFEDKQISINTVTNTAPQIFELVLEGLAQHEAKVYDDHYDLAFGQLNDFSFTDREGNTHTGVRYAPDGFKRDHSKQWNQSRKIRLILRPS